MKKYLFLTIFGLVLFSAPAYANAASLSLTSSSNSYNIGDIFDVNVVLDTQGAAAQGVDIRYLNYDPSFLEVQDADSGSSGVQILAGSLMVNTTANSVSGGKILFSQATSGSQTFSGSGTLATIKFKVLKVGSTQLNFDFTQGSSIDANIASNGQDILTSASGSNFTFSENNTTTNNDTGKTRVYLSPSSGTYRVGDSFSVNVVVDTNGKAIDAADIVLRYNNRIFQVLDSDPNKDGIQIQNGNLLSDVQINEVDPARSTINFSKTSQSSTFSGVGVLATVNFKAVSEGSRSYVTFYFRKNYSRDTNLVSNGEDILEEVGNAMYVVDHDNLPILVYGGSPNGTVFASRYQTVAVKTNKRATCKYSDTPNISYDSLRSRMRTRDGINHSVRLRVGNKINSLTTYVKCRDASNTHTSSSDYVVGFNLIAPPKFVVDMETHYRNYVYIDFFSPGSTNKIYGFYARPDRYGNVYFPMNAILSPGSYDITISSKNTLKKKMRSVVLNGGALVTFPKLLAGDLNGDGVVNSVDWSLVNSRWFKRDYDYDINGDSTINSIDWGFIKKNWLKVGDA